MFCDHLASFLDFVQLQKSFTFFCKISPQSVLPKSAKISKKYRIFKSKFKILAKKLQKSSKKKQLNFDKTRLNFKEGAQLMD